MEYNFRGQYSPTDIYYRKDVVSYQPTSSDAVKYYFCLQDNTGQLPLVGGDSMYWGVINAQSNFPNSVDTFLYRTTIQESDKVDIARITELSLKTGLSTSEQNELNTLILKHKNKYFSADDMNAIQQSISNLQMFFKTNVEGYIATKQAELTTAQTNAINTITTATNTALTAIDTKRASIDTYLQTTDVGSLRVDVGVKGDLTTDVKDSLVGAINEVDSHVDTLTAAVDLNTYVRSIGFATTTTLATNTYVITLSPAPTSYTNGMGISILINSTNTGAATINVNGLGAKAIKKANGNDVASGNLKSGSIYTLRYNGTNFILQGEGGEYGTATAPQVLSGHTIGTDSGLVSGTMVNNGAITITPGTTNQTIPSGYHNGSGYVIGDADLVSGNIRAGVNIFGVQGSSTVVDTADAILDPAYLLTGYSGYDDGVKKAGTMINRGAPTWTPTTSDQALSAGYYSGGTVKGDANLVASNIKSGVTLFGLTGTGPTLKMAKMTATGPSTWTNYIYDVNFSGMAFTPEFAAVLYVGSIYKNGSYHPNTSVPMLATNDSTAYIVGSSDDLFVASNLASMSLGASILNATYGSCTLRIIADSTVNGIAGSGSITVLFFGK